MGMYGSYGDPYFVEPWDEDDYEDDWGDEEYEGVLDDEDPYGYNFDWLFYDDVEDDAE